MLLDEDQVALRYLRAYRHGLANQLQFVSGWLELGDVARARAALAALRARLEAEARLASALPEPLAAYLLAQAVLSEDRGVSVDFDLAPGAPAAGAADPGRWQAARAQLADGWRRLEAACLGGAGPARLRVRLAGTRLVLEAPDAGVPPVAIDLAAGAGGTEMAR